jgi:glycosyltransferase involved in cell wall biosynthesis
MNSRDASTRSRPTVIFLGKSRVPQVPSSDYKLKLAITARYVRPIFIGTGRLGRRHIEGIFFLVMPALRPPALAGIVFYLLAPLMALVVAIRHRAAAIVCQSPYEAAGTVLSARLVPRSVRPKVVVDAHGDWRLATRFYGLRSRRILAPVADRLADWVLRHADSVRTTSAWLESKVRQAGYKGQIESTITFSDFEPFLTSPPKPLPAEPRALFVGRLDRVKGATVLLDAWQKVVNEVPSARLTVVGEGPQLSSLQRRVKGRGIGDSVFFAGSLPRERVQSHLDQSCIVMVPSFSEGFGRIIVEAMARGRPVVASDVAAIPELVDNGNTGRLVSPGDVDSLARTTVDLFADRAALIRMSEAARVAALAHNPARKFESSLGRLAEWAVS